MRAHADAARLAAAETILGKASESGVGKMALLSISATIEVLIAERDAAQADAARLRTALEDVREEMNGLIDYGPARDRVHWAEEVARINAALAASVDSSAGAAS